MAQKDDIKYFIGKLKDDYGYLPKFDLGQSDQIKLYYNTPYFSDEELVEFIHTFLFGKWSTNGAETHKFELEFSRVNEVGRSLFVNSGSSANLLMLAAMKERYNWKDGAEVIVSVAGFSTTYSAIILNKLTPVFIDIELDTFNFDLNKLEEKITTKTVAILNSPMLGNPVDMTWLVDICYNYNLVLLQDNCDSLGTTWKGNSLPSYADASTCSFYVAHGITTIEGGMVSSDDDKFMDICRSLSSWGNSCVCSSIANTFPNGVCGKRFSDWLGTGDIVDHKYIYQYPGYNLHSCLDAQASIGMVQLSKLSEIKDNRKKSKETAELLIKKYIPDVYIPASNKYADTCWFATPIRYSNKQKLVQQLEINNIQTRDYFCNNSLLHPAFKSYGNWKDYQNANILAKEVFFIGANPNWNEKHFDYLEKVLKEYVNG